MWLTMYVLLAYILATTVATEVQPSIIMPQNNDYFGYMDKFTGFNCEASGSNLKYTWKHKDILVTKKYILKFPTVDASVLKPLTQFLNLDYEGTYQCFAENSIGRIFGRKATVKFTAVGQFNLAKTETKIQDVTVGLSFALHCPEHRYSYNVKYNWQYEEGGFGVTLPSDPHYFVTKNGTLHFATVTEADIKWINSKGGIQCTQTADVQKQTRSFVSHNIMLRVDSRRPVVVNKLVKPEIKTVIWTQSVFFGAKNVYFKCGAIGNPVPTLKWFKLDRITFERTEIKNGSGYNLQSFNQSLSISEVNSNKAGEYLCEATNSQGKHEATGKIIVSNRLQWRVGEELTDQEPPSGGKFVWECGALGGPTYNWYKNGKPIQRTSSGKMRIRHIDGKSQLIFDNITKDDNGMYQCTAANEKDIIYSTGRLQVKGPKKPEFTEDMGPVTLIKRTTGVISCPVDALPLPTITWRKNSLELRYNDRIKLADNKVDLVIVNITKADQGIYVCHAENSLGTAEDSSNVTVRGKKPKFTEDMGPVTLIKRTTGVISCPVDALPLPTITWRKNSLKLRYNDHIKLADNNVDLVIVNITKSDQGFYVCHAENAFGIAEDSSNVTVVGKKPEFTEDMGPVTLIKRTTGVISCPVDALPLPTITWRKNSLELRYNDHIKLADNKVDLVIVNITKADQGIYVCHAENSLGTAEDSSNVTVGGKKPKFTEDMGPVTLIKRTTGVISCPVDALPLPTITWRKNSLKLRYNDHIKLADNNVDLVIVNITKSDQGFYVCHAENAFGIAEDSSNVTVVGEKPEFTEGMGPVTLIKRTTGVISCPVDALPLPTITWGKNSLKLRYNDRIKLADNKVDLVIVNITKADQGIYVCHAENSLGTAEDSSNVTVGGKKPEFTEDMGPVTLIKRTTGVISCPVDALPLPTITWRKNSLKLRYNDHIKLADNNVDLVIVNITKSDQGFYVCHAENAFGIAEDSSNVTVVGKKPEFTEDMGPVTLIKRTTGVISCPVDALPLPTITWRKNSLKLRYNDHIKLADNNVDLVIVNITKSDQGFYVCHAENAFGIAEDSSNVTVVGKKPEFTEDIGPVTLIKRTTGVISCPVDALPLPTITWRKNSLKLRYNDRVKLADNKIDLVIVNVTKADQGIYVCFAENSLGTAADSTFVVVEEYVATGGNFRPSSSRIILTILLYIFVICSTL